MMCRHNPASPAIQGSSDVTELQLCVGGTSDDRRVSRDEAREGVPDIIVETCAMQKVECYVEQTLASLAVPNKTPKKARTSSDSVLYAKERLQHHITLEAESSLQSDNIRSTAQLNILHQLKFVAANTDCIRRYSDPFVQSHGQQILAKFDQPSVGMATETEPMDLSHGGKRVEECRNADCVAEDSLLLTKRLKLKRYLHDRYQLGLESTSRLEVHSDSEIISSRREDSGSDESGHVTRLKGIAPLDIKSETGSEPATPSVFPSPTHSVTSYSPALGSPHSSMDSPGAQGSFFRFHVPPELPVVSSVHDWMARDGQQPTELHHFPMVTEYPLMPRFVAQQRKNMWERASTLPFSPPSGSSSKCHLWRPMAASASLHTTESTHSPPPTKTRFLFQPEAFSQHLRLTESPPRSPFSPSFGWTPRSATLHPNYQISAGMSIPSRSFIDQQSISASASFHSSHHFSQDPVSPRDTMTSFSCPACRDVLPSYAALADHMVTHIASETQIGAEGSKVYVCKGCKRTFSRSDMLTRHMRLHTGLKPYECAICGQVFSRSDHLHTHLRTHTGEKPYQCSLCSYAAPRRDMITRHMRVHGKRAVGSTRGRSLSSSSCSDAVSPAADVGDVRKFSLSSADSTESCDVAMRGAGSPTRHNQFCDYVSNQQLTATDSLLHVLSIKQSDASADTSGHVAGGVVSDVSGIDAVSCVPWFNGSEKESSSSKIE